MDLEQLVVPRLTEIVGRQGPLEIRMVDVGHARGRSNVVDVPLQRLSNRRAVVGLDQPFEVQPVDVDGFLLGL